MKTLIQGSPTPRPRTVTGPWPVRNRTAQQEVSTERGSEASSVFTAASHLSRYRLSSASCQHCGELYNYFIKWYNVIIIEIKYTISVMPLNHPETIPPPRHRHPWKNCPPRNLSLVPKRLGTAAWIDKKRKSIFQLSGLIITNVFLLYLMFVMFIVNSLKSGFLCFYSFQGFLKKPKQLYCPMVQHLHPTLIMPLKCF